MNIKAFIISAAILIIGNQYVNAQMDCRSMIGAHLTPFSKDGNLLWAVEGTMGPGIMTSPYDSVSNAKLNGGMLLGALDFSFMKGKSHFYLEGGYKNWKNSELVDTSSFTDSKHLGMRQAFYSYTTEKTKIKLGLHETRLGNFFLVDERIFGASINHEIGAFTINARAGSVNKSFARMGKFCSNRHLYSIINKDFTEKIGEKIGETNLAGFVINWNPNYVKEKPKTNNDDEFSEDNNNEFSESNTDEFHENHDFNEFGDSNEFSDENETNKKQKVSVENVALVFYDEFGSDKYVPNNKFYTGALLDLELPFEVQMQTGAVYQNMQDNNSVVYIAKLGKRKSWDNGSLTKISGAYIGKYNIDDDAIFQPFFSNLFIGEIVRMDAPNFPLWQAAIKHNFPGKLKMHLAFKAVGEIENAQTNEQDIEFGLLALKNHLKLTLIGSRVESLNFPNDIYMARLEVRVAF